MALPVESGTATCPECGTVIAIAHNEDNPLPNEVEIAHNEDASHQVTRLGVAAPPPAEESAPNEE